MWKGRAQLSWQCHVSDSSSPEHLIINQLVFIFSVEGDKEKCLLVSHAYSTWETGRNQTMSSVKEYGERELLVYADTHICKIATPLVCRWLF